MVIYRMVTNVGRLNQVFRVILTTVSFRGVALTPPFEFILFFTPHGTLITIGFMPSSRSSLNQALIPARWPASALIGPTFVRQNLEPNGAVKPLHNVGQRRGRIPVHLSPLRSREKKRFHTIGHQQTLSFSPKD